VLDEWAEWQQMLDDRDLSMDEENQPLKSNPAAVGAGTEDGDGDARGDQLRRIK
jgi:hypothetical protein